MRDGTNETNESNETRVKARDERRETIDKTRVANELNETREETRYETNEMKDERRKSRQPLKFTRITTIQCLGPNPLQAYVHRQEFIHLNHFNHFNNNITNYNNAISCMCLSVASIAKARSCLDNPSIITSKYYLTIYHPPLWSLCLSFKTLEPRLRSPRISQGDQLLPERVLKKNVNDVQIKTKMIIS